MISWCMWPCQAHWWRAGASVFPQLLLEGYADNSKETAGADTGVSVPSVASKRARHRLVLHMQYTCSADRQMQTLLLPDQPTRIPTPHWGVGAHFCRPSPWPRACCKLVMWCSSTTALLPSQLAVAMPQVVGHPVLTDCDRAEECVSHDS